MNRDLLAHLPVVVSVAAHRGFASAAAALNMSPSAVSHAVRAVEDRLGEPLFARTTRSVSLTEAGERFIASVSPALDDIGKAVEGLAADRGEVTGVLRINAPRVAVKMALTPVLARLARAHPRLIVEVHTNDAFVDIVAQGFDAGIRLGEAVQQDMVTVRLTPPFKAVMVAAPDYLQARGTPQSIADLASHNCIGFRLLASGSFYEWDLSDGGSPVSFRTSGTAVITDATFARDLALAGVGIAYIFEPLVRGDIGEKRLQWLLPQTAIEEPGLFLYFPQRASLAPKLRAFIDAARSSPEQ
ncbi:LysR family transcriptional regulator [Variovorax sp. J2P1-59]|uniref:LysR family transcriptional regulator n=1 Tax=Variovorax flavidus TaxID=3053501 RepID=UPI0025750046|nr:LysR family transcriptional regulator [Variovorax sp. J2P1-59]MDM0074888.1 LysR family transcriptional regulator [Variovorax sp. J2P1-59]